MARLNLLSALACALASAGAVDVFAHFMVTNSYGYDIAQWKTDMEAARQVGIDGFSLNWSPPNCDASTDLSWFVDRINDAYAAAEEMDFKLYHSFDMDNGDCATFFTKDYMQSIIAEQAGSKAAYRWNSNILVTTFGGDTVDQYGNSLFQQLKDSMKSTNAISLAPALTSYSYQAQDDPAGATSSLLSDYPSIDGYKNWQAWPLDVKQNMTTEADEAFAAALHHAGRTGPYIMTISPWQFKDWPDVGGSWVQYSDTLWAERWAALAGADAFEPDIIEIVTWNDWPESHYIRDLPDLADPSAPDYAALGDFAGYIEGQNHAPWRIMAKYYIARIKHHKTAEPIMDQVVFWYRIHPKTSCASSIRNAALPDDAVFAWALVKEKATISVSVGSNQYWEFEADPSGPTMFSVPFPEDLGAGGVTPEVAIMRGGAQVQFGQGSKAITGACERANFNPVVNLVGPGVNSGR